MVNEKRDYNWGIAILRVLLAFAVVGGHFSSGSYLFKVISPLAVPCFMFLSFVFFERHLGLGKRSYFIERLKRLVIPYVVWPLIYLFVYSGLYALFNEDFLGRDWKTSFFFQVLFGHSILPVLWFHWCLILLTVTVYCCSFLPKVVLATSLFFIVFLSFLFQYSGFNDIFADFRFELKYPLGRFVEMLPYCIVGCALGSFLTSRFCDVKLRVRALICFFSIIAFFVFSFVPEHSLRSDYGYAGCVLFLKTLSVAAFFWFAPIGDSIEVHPAVKAILKVATRYTMGIYCLHFMIGQAVNRLSFVSNGILKCLIIYLASYVSCFVVDALARNNKWMKQLIS